MSEIDKKIGFGSDTHGYHCYVMYHDYASDYPSAFKCYVRVPRNLAEESLSDAIMEQILLQDSKFRLITEPATHVNTPGWERRLLAAGAVDEMSSGIQSMYFSPRGQTVCLFAYIDAEWMDY